MILLIDNYDSFVYNLASYLQELGAEVAVVRNDALTVDEIVERSPSAVVLSPGPGTPIEAGISIELVSRLIGRVPLLGVCLGHQALAAATGGRVVRAPRPVHGQVTLVEHDGTGLFEGLPQPLTATRYHSLIVDPDSLEPAWQITARADSGLVMAMAHREHLALGVQFHPESVLTESGHRLLWNFLTMSGVARGECPVSVNPVPRVRESHSLHGYRGESVFPDPETPSSSRVLHW
ncbi:MAG: aminodeoxychorismate/anthranilate synthase component II [Planctomycetaceae bacterium]